MSKNNNENTKCGDSKMQVKIHKMMTTTVMIRKIRIKETSKRKEKKTLQESRSVDFQSDRKARKISS